MKLKTKVESAVYLLFLQSKKAVRTTSRPASAGWLMRRRSACVGHSVMVPLPAWQSPCASRTMNRCTGDLPWYRASARSIVANLINKYVNFYVFVWSVMNEKD